jgi:hypothetical protein
MGRSTRVCVPILPPKRTLPLYGLGLDVAQALHKSSEGVGYRATACGGQIPMAGIRRLLRARRERPRCCRAAEERDELTLEGAAGARHTCWIVMRMSESGRCH